MTPLCPIHHCPLSCPKCTGAKGGKSRSAKKLAAIRKNAKLGGRPRKKSVDGNKASR